MTTTNDREHDDELDRLLDAVYRTYHHDFRGYQRASLRRAVAQAKASLGIPTVGQLVGRVACDPGAFDQLLRCITIRVSDLFRDPAYYRALRDHVIPRLATYPSIRIWIAGCGTGEEAYSIAILLHEAGLLGRSLIYATDIATDSLNIGATGVYELACVSRFTENYTLAGGCASLADYYATDRAHIAFVPQLRDRVMFSEHSLATDAAFAEVQLVSCRNVLIYFDRALQDRAIGLFRESLCSRGFLGLGAKETLMLSEHAREFAPLDAEARLYRKVT